jgi:hypothetical protein
MVLPMLSKNGEDYMSFILLNGDVFMSFTSKHTNVKETTSPAITLKNKKQMIQGVFDEVF